MDMKPAKVCSSNDFEIDDEVMSKINMHTRKELTKDEIYAFPVVLCDNDVDRDNERFSVKTLEVLAEMFIGKTGIFDHNPKGENQTARIFDTEIKVDKSKKTVTGEDYTYLLAKAYMIKTNKTNDLISEIEAGIKKEVSISCKIDSEICSICKADMRVNPCSHIKGRTYGKKVCHTVLENPTDAYEWSFVAIPAQPNAGVSKEFAASFDNEIISIIKNIGKSKEELISELEQKNNLISKLYESLRRDVISMKYLYEPLTASEDIEKNISELDCEKMLDVKESLLKKASKKSFFNPQLWTEKDSSLLAETKNNKTNNNEFKLEKSFKKRRKNYV